MVCMLVRQLCHLSQVRRTRDASKSYRTLALQECGLRLLTYRPSDWLIKSFFFFSFVAGRGSALGGSALFSSQQTEAAHYYRPGVDSSTYTITPTCSSSSVWAAGWPLTLKVENHVLKLRDPSHFRLDWEPLQCMLKATWVALVEIPQQWSLYVAYMASQRFSPQVWSTYSMQRHQTLCSVTGKEQVHDLIRNREKRNSSQKVS